MDYIRSLKLGTIAFLEGTLYNLRPRYALTLRGRRKIIIVLQWFFKEPPTPVGGVPQGGKLCRLHKIRYLWQGEERAFYRRPIKRAEGWRVGRAEDWRVGGLARAEERKSGRTEERRNGRTEERKSGGMEERRNGKSGGAEERRNGRLERNDQRSKVKGIKKEGGGMAILEGWKDGWLEEWKNGKYPAQQFTCKRILDFSNILR